MIHHVFHISQLKLFVSDYTPVYGSLLFTTDLEAAATTPQAIIDRRLVRQGAMDRSSGVVSHFGRLPRPQPALSRGSSFIFGGEVSWVTTTSEAGSAYEESVSIVTWHI